jgi:hypothetical protein
MKLLQFPSSHLRRPAPLGCQILCPALAAVGEVIAVADQALVELAGEQGDAVDASVVAEPVAGDAHLAATATE